MNKGKLIVIDGIDGSGKSTQTELLRKRLKVEGVKTFYLHFPQHGKRSAALVDDYLNGKYGKLDPYKTSLLYAVDRLDGSFAIRRELDRGTVVILDRYTPANAGHQGGKIADKKERLAYFKWLVGLEYKIIGLPVPDTTFILHIPARLTQKLVDKKEASHKQRKYLHHKKRDLHEADLEHLKNAERAYLEVASVFPKTKVIECTKDGKLMSVLEIHERLWREVNKIIKV